MVTGGSFTAGPEEARAGIEPANSGFADRCLTTWLPRHAEQPTDPPLGVQASALSPREPAEKSVRISAAAPSASTMLRNTLDYVTDGVIDTGHDGRIRWLNTAALALLGLPPGREHVGRAIESFAAAESVPVLQAAALHALGNGAWIGDTVLRHSGGAPIPVTLTIVAHHVGDSGVVRGWSYVVRAIASPIRIKSDRAESRRFESVGRLAGGIAHDVQNALAEVVSASEELASAADITDARRHDLDAIRAAAERASDLVRQLAAYQRAMPER